MLSAGDVKRITRTVLHAAGSVLVICGLSCIIGVAGGYDLDLLTSGQCFIRCAAGVAACVIGAGIYNIAERMRRYDTVRN